MVFLAHAGDWIVNSLYIAPLLIVVAALLAAGAVAISACGQGDSTRAGGAPSSRLVDFAQPPPWDNAFDIDAATGDPPAPSRLVGAGCAVPRAEGRCRAALG